MRVAKAIEARSTKTRFSLAKNVGLAALVALAIWLACGRLGEYTTGLWAIHSN